MAPPVAHMDAKTTTVRSFLRSLNILLKDCRLYGLDHSRTSAQLKTAWDDLSSGLKAQGELQIAASSSRLMIDGTAIKATPAESSFAQMVSAAGISSIQFTSQATQDEFERFVRAFASSGPKFEGLSSLLQQALGESEACGIRINEFRVVAADAADGSGQARAAGEAMAKVLGADLGELKDALADPQKLLALIAAAEGVTALQERQANGGTAAGSGGTASDAAPDEAPIGSLFLGNGPAPSSAEAGELAVFRMLGQLGQSTGAPGAPIRPEHFQQQVAALPAEGQKVLWQAVASLAADSPQGNQDPLLLLKLAERLAIRIAIKRFERGDAKVDAVQELLSRMGGEIERLRARLTSYEKKTQEAEKALATPERLEQQFWDALPAENKLGALLSPEAFKLPNRHIRQSLEHLTGHGEVQTPRNVLGHYAEGVGDESADTRRRVLEGIADLDDLYAAAGNETLKHAIAAIGAQLLVEQESEL